MREYGPHTGWYPEDYDEIHWVPQEDTNGCAVAALAMVTGKSYREVRDYFGIDFAERGTHVGGIEQYLTDHGYAWARLCHYDHLSVERTPWPPEPFGDVHICQVVGSASHTVVMLGDGTVLDPLTPEPKRLSDYQAVHYVAAVVERDK